MTSVCKIFACNCLYSAQNGWHWCLLNPLRWCYFLVCAIMLSSECTSATLMSLYLNWSTLIRRAIKHSLGSSEYNMPAVIPLSSVFFITVYLYSFLGINHGLFEWTLLFDWLVDTPLWLVGGHSSLIGWWTLLFDWLVGDPLWNQTSVSVFWQ